MGTSGHRYKEAGDEKRTEQEGRDQMICAAFIAGMVAGMGIMLAAIVLAMF